MVDQVQEAATIPSNNKGMPPKQVRTECLVEFNERVQLLQSGSFVVRAGSKCDWACKYGTCGHMIFAYFFKLSSLNFLYYYVIAMQFSILSKHLIGFTMPVAECKYSVPVLRYDLLCDKV